MTQKAFYRALKRMADVWSDGFKSNPIVAIVPLCQVRPILDQMAREGWIE